jgi:Sec-independent protein translocase protein TatA
MGFAFIFESVGGTEWFVLLGVVLIVVGPRNLPSAARKLGQMMTNLRRAADEFKRQLMSMDQEVRKEVDNAIADNSSSTSSAAEATSDSTATDEGGNPYPEGSPYPGHEDFYDETSYDDYGYGDSPDGDDSSTTGEDSSSGGDEVSPEPPAEPAQPPPPTEEELRRVTITVSAAPGKGK